MASEEVALRRKAERIAAIGGIARTVQHDINNLLTVVFANLEMLKRTAAEGAPQRQLGRVEEAARRFEGTSRAILSLIRRPAGEQVEIRLSEALAALRPLLHMILPGPGALVLELAERDPMLRFERSALEEGLLALAQQIAETQPRGLALAVTVADRPEAGTLEIRPAAGLAPPPALEALAEVAHAAGGTAERDGETLRLRLPPRGDGRA
jgi:signal transduction histidine kinase